MARETITIVNKSGKVVGTSKHLVNIFNEAKSAYNERKAELKATRKSQVGKKDDERKVRKRLAALTVEDDDTQSRRSSRRGSDDERRRRKRHSSERYKERPPIERGVSDTFLGNAESVCASRRGSHRPSPLRQDSDDEPRLGELVRRHTEGDMLENHASRSSPKGRSASLDHIDMDLAYGELPPQFPESKHNDEIELRAKMTGLQRLLDECNCLQHSVTAIIDNLQKNPDALAAVAVTLAEISNIASKMAPGALATMKGSFPAAVALLASPEFAIAVGVGVGVTVIALGGYKIIKKIKGDKENSMLREAGGEREPGTPDSEVDSLREINRIEMWRRGIADAEAESLGTSVDGEFVTPMASKTLIDEGRLTEADLKSSDGKKKRRKHKSSKTAKDDKSEKSKSDLKSKSKKEPSGIRMLFKGQS